MDRIVISQDQITLGHVIIADPHGARMVPMALALAQRLKVKDQYLPPLANGTRYHDVGKAWVPDWIAYKAGRLTEDEFARMKMHPLYGAKFLEAIDVNGPVREIVRHHHERWDGTGYPDGLAGLDIPMLARLVAVVDTYDALMGHRNYPRYDAKGVPLSTPSGEFGHTHAIHIIASSAGTHFDPRVVGAFCRMKDREFR